MVNNNILYIAYMYYIHYLQDMDFATHYSIGTDILYIIYIQSSLQSNQLVNYFCIGRMQLYL